MAKRGRKPKHHVTADGETIVGLTKRTDGRFGPVGVAGVTFGTDEATAIARFRKWEAERDGTAWEKHSGDDAKVDAIYYGMRFTGPGKSSTGAERRLEKTALAYAAKYKEFIRNLILTNPQKAAIELDIEELRWFDELRPPGTSLRLEDIGNAYRSKRKKISDTWRRKVKLFWVEFVEAVGVETVAEITADDISRYHDAVWDDYEKNDRSPTYVAHRFQCVKTILNHAMKQGKDHRQLRRVIDLCAMFTSPDKAGTDPHPISREHLHALLEVSDAKWQAIFLLALNAAFYPSEVAAVKKTHVDLDARTLVMDRGKTGVPRIAVLWERTVEAIREYQAGSRNESEYLFVSATGAPYNANHASRNFRRRRTEAELPEEVKFDNIRDGAYTAAVDGGADVNQAKMLAGHRVGISDHYLKRNPSMVDDACRAIEKVYFG